MALLQNVLQLWIVKLLEGAIVWWGESDRNWPDANEYHD